MSAWDVLLPLVALVAGAAVTAVALRRRRAVDEDPPEKPRILFLHYWGRGKAADLAAKLKSALDTQSK